ncbi:MAG: PEP/pyruvate-binding domain-containing protein, partial [Anaerolineaceae bacterium]|nr:PEP/pyruvate-binding domain-containing protein [Anaerolineaceae bacterium]
MFQPSIPNFDRVFGDKGNRISIIGTGHLGGKAQGLVMINDVLTAQQKEDDFPEIDVNIPNMVVIGTDIFDSFMQQNKLFDIAYSDLPDDDIVHSFQKADLPFEILGDLRALISQAHKPLAIRSSGLLEDATHEPFAGIYATKMIPNNQSDIDTRFRKLVEAIKFVYASTFFQNAKDYLKMTNHRLGDEKMAVIIQEVVGKRHYSRFYPELSGVARSYNYYPVGSATHEDGVVNLALGLGKSVVDGGASWAYSPAYPKVPPPFGSMEELLDHSQTEFWSINTGEPPAYDPTNETEFMLLENLTTAELDNTLERIVSTYDHQSGRLTIGTGKKGPRALTFAPLLVLDVLPLNRLVKKLLKVCETELNASVEIEFAMTFDPHWFGFLQVRHMVVSSEVIEISIEEQSRERVLAASGSVLGNGINNDIRDIVYVIPEGQNLQRAASIVPELARINAKLMNKSLPYLLIVFGRLGSSDQTSGIPVIWR